MKIKDYMRFTDFCVYWEGYTAAQMGEPINSNPEIYDPEYGIWEMGWLHGKSKTPLDSGPKATYNKT